MKFVFLAVFAVMTTLHLIASIKKDQRFRDLTKGFILTSLLGVYASMTTEVNWLVVCALIFSWIGDMLLIVKGIKWFAFGGISFFISHIFFILAYSFEINFAIIPIYLIIIIVLAFSIISTFIFKYLKPHIPKSIFIPMLAYLIINGVMNSFAIFRIISEFNIATLLTVIGAVLFYISDAALFFVRFKKDSIQKTHFLVMLTYSLGELLIVLGLAL